MLLRSGGRHGSRLLVLGLVMFALANVGRYVVERKLPLHAPLTDAQRGLVLGVLYGISFGVMLLGIRQRRRALRGEARPC